jgi:hypothetical protein
VLLEMLILQTFQLLHQLAVEEVLIMHHLLEMVLQAVQVAVGLEQVPVVEQQVQETHLL